jgi:hypothetical protein
MAAPLNQRTLATSVIGRRPSAQLPTATRACSSLGKKDGTARPCSRCAAPPAESRRSTPGPWHPAPVTAQQRLRWELDEAREQSAHHQTQPQND